MTRSIIGNKSFECGAARNIIFGSAVVRAKSHVSLACPIFHFKNRIFGIGIHFQDCKDIFYNIEKRGLIRLILTCFFFFFFFFFWTMRKIENGRFRTREAYIQWQKGHCF